MECERCGATNRPAARYCSECGVALTRRCDRCGQELAPSARFCDECGTPTARGAALVEDSEPAAARKTVTVVFADLVGSTGFGERTDPEQTRLVMARYHALLKEVVEHHDGRVAKFMGDGVLAYFGWPRAHEDDAERAVRLGCRDVFRQSKLLDRIIPDIEIMLAAGEIKPPVAPADSVGPVLPNPESLGDAGHRA